LSRIKKKICFTSGDINGIGLETFLKAFSDGAFDSSKISLITNSEILAETAEHLYYDLIIEAEIANIAGRSFSIVECTTYPELDFGKISKDAGLLAGESIEKAVSCCLSGEQDAMVTLPIQKESVYLAGWTYPGHTEMIASRCGVKDPLMIMESKGTRVCLLTIHIPLKDVPNYITPYRIKSITEKFIRSVNSDFGVDKPRIALLALNPHGGENGSIGTEELDIYNATIDEINGYSNDEYVVEGPFPADGFFAHGAYKKYDGIIASYHDQGLIPLKLLAEGGGVNYTGGLQIIRTSPDHGTAMDIAGKNISNPQSLVDAYNLAFQISDNRNNR
jgi:4-hydroxythreonine-4-phosphate dehydrogenase